jgi:hypothetical protein
MDILVFFLISRKALFFIVQCDVSCGFFRDTFCQFEEVPFGACLLSVSFHIRVLDLSNAFSASIEIIIFARPHPAFVLLVCQITLIDFHMLTHPCMPGINPTWSWCVILLVCCWI